MESYWYSTLNEQKSLEAEYYNAYKAAAENRINLINETVKALKEENLELDLQNIHFKSFLTNVSASSILVETQKNSILQSLSSLYDELSSNAVSIGETIVNGISSGMNKEKKYVQVLLFQRKHCAQKRRMLYLFHFRCPMKSPHFTDC